MTTFGLPGLARQAAEREIAADAEDDDGQHISRMARASIAADQADVDDDVENIRTAAANAARAHDAEMRGPIFGVRRDTGFGQFLKGPEYALGAVAEATEKVVDSTVALGTGLIRWPVYAATGGHVAWDAPTVAGVADYFTEGGYSEAKNESLSQLEGEFVRRTRQVANEVVGLWASFGMGAAQGVGMLGKAIGAPGTFAHKTAERLTAGKGMISSKVALAADKIATNVAKRVGMTEGEIRAGIATGTLARSAMLKVADKGVVTKVATWLGTNPRAAAATGLSFAALETLSGKPGVVDPAIHGAITTAMGPAFLALGRLATHVEHAIAKGGVAAEAGQAVKGFMAGGKWRPGMARATAGAIEGLGFGTLLSPRETMEFMRAVYNGDGEKIGDGIVRILGTAGGMAMLRGFRSDPDHLATHRALYPEDRVKRFEGVEKPIDDAVAALQILGYVANQKEPGGPISFHRPGEAPKTVEAKPADMEGAVEMLRMLEQRAMTDQLAARADYKVEAPEVAPGVWKLPDRLLTVVDGKWREKLLDTESEPWRDATEVPEHRGQEFGEDQTGAEVLRKNLPDRDALTDAVEWFVRRQGGEHRDVVELMLAGNREAAARVALGFTRRDWEEMLQLKRSGATDLETPQERARKELAGSFDSARVAEMRPAERAEVARMWTREYLGRTGGEAPQAEDMARLGVSERTRRRIIKEESAAFSTPKMGAEGEGIARPAQPADRAAEDPLKGYGATSPEWMAGRPGTAPIKKIDVIRTLRGAPGDPVQVRESVAKPELLGSATGAYFPYANYTRVLYGDIATLAHEWAHAFEARLGKARGDRWEVLLPEFLDAEGREAAEHYSRDALAAMSDPAKRREFFAELVARHLLGDTRLEARTPKLLEFLDKLLHDHPDFADQFERVRDALTRYREQGSMFRGEGEVLLQSDVDKLESGGTAKAAVDWVVKAFINDLAAVQRAEASVWAYETGKPASEYMANVRPSESFYKMSAALHMTAAHQAIRMVEGGTFNAVGERTGVHAGKRSLVDIWKAVRAEEVLAFSTYWKTLREIEMVDRGLSVSATKEELEFRRDQYEKDHPEWRAVVLESVAFLNRCFDYAVEMGAYTREEVERMTTPRDRETGEVGPDGKPVTEPAGGYEFYVPFLRYFEPEMLAVKPGQRMETGSKRAAVDPLEQFLKMVHQIIAHSHMASANRALVTAWASGPGMGALIHPADPDPATGQTTLDMALGPQVASAMVSRAPKPGTSGNHIRVAVKYTEAELADIERRALERAGNNPTSQAHAKFAVDHLRKVNGRRSEWSVNNTVYSAIVAASDGIRQRADALSESMAPFKKVGRSLASLVRLGATGANLGFVMKNLVRDALSYPLYTSKPGSLFAVWTAGAREMLKAVRQLADKSGVPAADAYKALIGGSSTYAHTSLLAPTLKRNDVIRETRNVWQRIRGKLQGFVDILAKPEQWLRYTEFRDVYEARLKEGWSQRDAAFEAVLASKEITTDFTRAGVLARQLNSYIPFFNAAIQGNRRFYGTLGGAWGKAAQARLWMRGAISMGGLSALQWFFFGDSDDYKALSDYERLNYWNFWIGETRIRIPKPFETGRFFTTPIEQAYDRLSGTQAVEAKDALWDWLVRPLIPPIMPAGAVPVLEAKSGFSFFRDRPIVPEWLAKERLPEDQYFRYTSGAARTIGKVFGISPARVEAFVGEVTGGLGPNAARWADDVFDWLEGKTPLSPNMMTLGATQSLLGHSFQGSRQVDEFYDAMKLLRQKRGSKKASAGEEQALRLGTRVQEQLSAMREMADDENWSAEKIDREVQQVVVDALPDMRFLMEDAK